MVTSVPKTPSLVPERVANTARESTRLSLGSVPDVFGQASRLRTPEIALCSYPDDAAASSTHSEGNHRGMHRLS
jgi:hypothetical protein